MNDLKTVQESGTLSDPLYQKQKEGVARMRASLLACTDSAQITRNAIQNITNLRIYHQVARIIKYIEMADKLEQKIYDSLDISIQTLDDANPATWLALLEVQERLQKLLIDSHKLLQPYLDLQEFSIADLTTNSEASPMPILLDSASRDKLRTSAQAVLKALEEKE